MYFFQLTKWCDFCKINYLHCIHNVLFDCGFNNLHRIMSKLGLRNFLTVNIKYTCMYICLNSFFIISRDVYTCSACHWCYAVLVSIIQSWHSTGQCGKPHPFSKGNRLGVPGDKLWLMIMSRWAIHHWTMHRVLTRDLTGNIDFFINIYGEFNEESSEANRYHH